ncbi:hypothetical protein LGQ02_16155 [Bacillus shivajii]|uniref:hypothetical protein n=1 Tax=Bacillus shivajii TaxID=1983719 RepID=UPI001CFB21FB|nr:hypothetical protein [Bacillus shivajii]UCZ52362.1 hypothetical protein LGQ02_16155 [Bacillus shivajii]
MKRILSFLFLTYLIFAITACVPEDPNQKTDEKGDDPIEEEQEDDEEYDEEEDDDE